MIEKPENYINAFIEAGADLVSIHPEACYHAHRTLQAIRQLGRKACAAINPSTPLEVLEYILEDMDMVLIMTVNPGFGGQKYIPAMTRKIENMREMIEKKGLNIDIEVDGGISPANVYEVTKAGANVIVAGSAVFHSPEPGEVIKDMRKAAFVRRA